MKSSIRFLVISVFSLIMLIGFLNRAFAQEEIVHNFFGNVVSNSTIVSILAEVNGKEYRTKPLERKYGYDPPFKVVGNKSEEIRFYFEMLDRKVYITNKTLLDDGVTRLDLIQPIQPLAVKEGNESKNVKQKEEENQKKKKGYWQIITKSKILITALITIPGLFVMGIVILFLSRNKLKTSKADLVNKRLVAYIRLMLERGYTKEYIIDYLKYTF